MKTETESVTVQGIKFDVQSLLEEARSQIATAIVADAKNQLSWTVGRQLAEEIQPLVKQFVTEEIVPELQALLFEQKSVILEAAVQAAVLVGESVAKKLVTDAQNAMASNYQRTKIMEAIFGK